MAANASARTRMHTLVCSGFIMNKEEIPPWASWMVYGSLFNYAFEALAINEFDGLYFLWEWKGDTVHPRGVRAANAHCRTSIPLRA